MAVHTVDLPNSVGWIWPETEDLAGVFHSMEICMQLS